MSYARAPRVGTENPEAGIVLLLAFALHVVVDDHQVLKQVGAVRLLAIIFSSRFDELAVASVVLDELLEVPATCHVRAMVQEGAQSRLLFACEVRPCLPACPV